MIIFVSLILLLVVFIVIVYPFYQKGLKTVTPAENEKLRELDSKRDTSYSMLKELEFDYASGILTEEDYRDLEIRYKKKAIGVLKAIDNLEKGDTAEDTIEMQVRQIRQKRGGESGIERSTGMQVSQARRKGNEDKDVEDDIERQVSRLRGKRTVTRIPREAEKPDQGTRNNQVHYCTQCGTKSRESDKYCSNCGAELN